MNTKLLKIMKFHAKMFNFFERQNNVYSYTRANFSINRIPN